VIITASVAVEESLQTHGKLFQQEDQFLKIVLHIQMEITGIRLSLAKKNVMMAQLIKLSISVKREQ
jgi:hypothetical protein